MLVSIELDGTREPDKTYFTLLFVAARQRGGVPPNEQKLDKAARRSDALIKKALYHTSDPIEKDGEKVPEPGAPDHRERKLKEELVTLTLPEPEFKRLRVDFFDNEHMVWGIDVADYAEEFSQLMSAAHETAKPPAVAGRKQVAAAIGSEE